MTDGIDESTAELPASWLTVRLATSDDVDDVVENVREVARWLTTKGVGQWGEDFPRWVVEAEVQERELFILRHDSETIGSIVLGRRDEIWGSDDPSAVFALRLVLRQGSRGRGLGRRVAAWVEDEGRRLGKKWVRLTCHDQNETLKAYYASLGYVHKGVRHYPRWEMDFSLFEKRL